MKEELLKGLTEEQIAKVKACKNREELLKIAKEEGVELNDEQLEAVSGGSICSSPYKCPKCGNTYGISTLTVNCGQNTSCICKKCGYEWFE